MMQSALTHWKTIFNQRDLPQEWAEKSVHILPILVSFHVPKCPLVWHLTP